MHNFNNCGSIQFLKSFVGIPFKGIIRSPDTVSGTPRGSQIIVLNGLFWNIVPFLVEKAPNPFHTLISKGEKPKKCIVFKLL